MDFKIKTDCSGIDWNIISETLRDVGMAHYEPDLHKKAFENSYITIFLYHKSQIVGFGRAISDGAYQAAVYDMAVIPDFQNKGVGKTIIKKIMELLPECNIILYASPGKEGFYIENGFRKMKTGMAYFINDEKMVKRGFTE